MQISFIFFCKKYISCWSSSPTNTFILKTKINTTICNLNLNYGDYSINKEFESTGIKKLIMLFDCFLSASTDGIVFIDEMDSNLNDIYYFTLLKFL